MWRRQANFSIGGAGRPRGAAAAAAIGFPEAEPGAEPPFDDSDWPAEFRGTNGSQKLMNIKSSFANQLLLVSLLEHLCHVYAQDPTRSRRLFQLLCKTFTQMGLLSDFAVCEEFSSLRLQHNRAITELMKAANKQIDNEEVGPGDSYKNRENEILFEAQTSRYVNEFDEISRLGKGGYGTVYKVRNKLDGQFYAIKKILIKKATKRDCMKVLREVKVLAQLQHPHIVGYHTAWMEHVQPTGGLVLDLPSLKMSSQPGNSKDQTGIQEMEDSSIIFASRSSEDSLGRNSKGTNGNACTLPPDTCGSSGENDTSHELRDNGNQSSVLHCCAEDGDSCTGEDPQNERPSHQPCMVEYHLMLHIQMQLCEASLCDWIASRNDLCLTATDASNPYHHIEKHWTLKIFQELLEGVYYIHSNGLMHRDIKGVLGLKTVHWGNVQTMALEKKEMLAVIPVFCSVGLLRGAFCSWVAKGAGIKSNIGTSYQITHARKEKRAVVYGKNACGTFHLSHCSFSDDGAWFRNQGEGDLINLKGCSPRERDPRNIFLQGPNHHVKIGDFGLACRDIIEEDTTHLLSAENNYAFIHTSGVGTCLYASPEQLQGSHYDFKSDMYSLGVILFELFQPFGTEMERTEVLMGLRRGSLPLSFCGKWPIQAKYVKLLTSDTSARRPTALQLLDSELFHNSANVICALQQKVMKQEEEIKLLKEKIKLLLEERDERDRINPLGSPV